MATPFALPSDLNDWLQQEVPDPTAMQALTVSSGAIRQFCGWSVSQETVTGLRLRPAAAWSLWLPTLYLTAVSSLTFGVLPYVYGVDFDWWENGRVELLTRRSLYVPTAATVTFTHGYPEGHSVLDAVRGVCLSAAARLAGNPLGHQSGTAGPFSWAGGTVGDEGATILTPGERAQLGALALPAVA